MQMNNNIIMPGLEDVKILKVEQMDDRLALFVEMEARTHTCPRCGAKTRQIHDYRMQKIKHLKWFERLCYIFYNKRRYRCDACEKRFPEKNNFVERYKRFTKEWNQAVNVRSVQAKTFKELAQQYGTSISTVIRRFDAFAENEVGEVKELPRVIAIDEYKGDTKEGKYQLIIANGDTREPLDILPNRKGKTISQYLRKYGANVEIVIMDMSHSFKSAVRKALDHPLIIADHFHFCRYIYWALDKVRRRIQSDWNDYDRKKCKKMRYVFYKDSAKLTENERWYLDRYRGMSKELDMAYQLKEAYCEWFKQAKENGSEGMRKTKEGLNTFYQLVRDTGVQEFLRSIRTFKNWEKEILNSFMYSYSNGFLEGINNHTKVIKRNAYGFRNFKRARARILLSHKYKGIGVHLG
ncbi:ISL3 family transposase [Bacillus andreraoultii]|uniref:ISL3 family transposase n=1 Tax=Bacillus andreraoultii TaxID=1499685 RepID=UPI0009E4F115|nr:ISL3 family transposase [Bacillus andreraoultii]